MKINCIIKSGYDECKRLHKRKTRRNHKTSDGNNKNNNITGEQCISYIPPKLYLHLPIASHSCHHCIRVAYKNCPEKSRKLDLGNLDAKSLGRHPERSSSRLSTASSKLLESIHSRIHSPSLFSLEHEGNETKAHFDFINSPDFQNVPENVQKFILSGAQVHHANYHGEIRGTKTDVHFCIYDQDDYAKLGRWTNHIERWLQFALEQRVTGCNREHIQIMLVMTPLEKYIPEPGQKVDETHANTAFTYSCSPKNRIIIYRKEDWFKTFIHETFHCLGLDFCDHRYANEFNSKIAQMFPGTDASTDYRIYESYCEIWAQIINHLFSIPKGSKSVFAKFERQMRKDTAFVIYQTQKYLDVYGLSYSDLLTNDNNNKNDGLYKEDTNVFSYFMLRSSLLWNLEEFLKYCVQNTNANQLFIDFGDNDEDKIAKYVDLIERTHKDPGFLRIAEWIRSKFLPIAKRKCDKKTRRQFKMTMMEHVT